MFFLGKCDRLRYCPRCRSGFVYPTGRTDHDRVSKRIDLRCGECGHRWHSVVSHARAALLDIELERDAASIRRSLEEFDLERMALYAETFAAALARDLIEPADFAA
jgi:hypothetical protein